MSKTISSGRLPFDAPVDTIESRIDARDREARIRAVDPRFNVALEASAGTGKTRVLVDRYINLLKANVDPSNILAITFTRKAAAEMRERIIGALREAAARGEITASRWRELRDRTADIGISTIDAFCLSLLREFPLEADLDPGFAMADDTEVPRLIDESLDRALRTCRAAAREDENMALVFAQLGDRRARAGLAVLLNRRIVAPAVLARFLESGPKDLTAAQVSRAAAHRILAVLAGIHGGVDGFVESGPPEPVFMLVIRAVQTLQGAASPDSVVDPAAVQAAAARIRDHFLTQDGQPRQRLNYTKAQFSSERQRRLQRDAVVGHGQAMFDAIAAYRRDLNILVARGVWRMFRIAEAEYRRTLESHAVLDFSDVLLRALALLRQMEEFSQSRYRLESRYHHVLVDEFQDTSRAQWELVSLLVAAWGEGAGLAHSGPLPPSIFIVGDRKQSIYRFRDADTSVLREAARHLEGLRPDRDVRRAISRSFRSVPSLLSFVNDVCHDMEKAAARPDAFHYDETDRFPLHGTVADADQPLGIVVGETPDACAEATAAEIARLLRGGTVVRDRDSGTRRPLTPGDVAILFRTRESHRDFEDALERRGVPSYVYKGLGFFDADEIKDVLALLWYLADPVSDLRAAAWLRSRVIGLSDQGLRQLSPRLADAVRSSPVPSVAADLTQEDQAALRMAREGAARWLPLVDRMPPAELLDAIVSEAAYFFELRGVRIRQARENLKKIRALIRRIQNRGYATLARVVEHLDRLAVGDEANAAIDALDAVNLMTVHASKGLEFPVVFVVNLARGTGNRRSPIRVAADPEGDGGFVSVGDFQSQADEDEGASEKEETKRLLYVALTRARDRLYLGTALKDGKIQAGRGSLAEVLPTSLLAVLTAAATADAVEWTASSGGRHPLHVCTQPVITAAPPEVMPDHGERGAAHLAVVGAADLLDDFGPPVDHAPLVRATVSTWVDADPGPLAWDSGAVSDRMIGTLVHRLIERSGLIAAVSDAEQSDRRQLVLRLMRPEESAEVDDRQHVASIVAEMHDRLCRRDDVRNLLADPKCRTLHEVPFVLDIDGAVVSGSIDCLLLGPSHEGADEPGEVTVLEIKTGRSRPEHAAQAKVYQRAAEAMFPGTRVSARLIYVGAE